MVDLGAQFFADDDTDSTTTVDAILNRLRMNGWNGWRP
jgi:hypothetical protein